ncbi:MAG TPA: phosphate acyltransferase PlsX [Candidatus Egerieisoma faecipullorum]|uniref:Phosphate acyltransferase n=1 Tax=Candidatus Egerieisoma faecipullorum TaxID=2840963 RepID=A0A9D1I7B4_9CLOT|nr:phosphate acyltransferase PlsX [Candidatus Egerieisoma faecipullorum]
MIVLVDAMGGDNAPYAIVKGCVEAINERGGFSVVLIGDEPEIRKILSSEQYDPGRITIRHTTQVITNDDVPTKAIRAKSDSSLTVGFKMLKEGKGDVFLSAGNSGALLVGSITILKRIGGIDRPCLGSVIPTKGGRMILVDSGLNMSCKAERYEQFAYLGAAYMKALFKTEEPRIGLVNIGSEDEKGPEIIKEANEMLRESPLNYIGYLEGKDLFEGRADVVVTDGFTGNVILKLIEGTSKYMFTEIKKLLFKNLRTKIGALFLKDGLNAFKKTLDPDINGGAPILGVDGLVLKSHGSSNAKTIRYVVLKACDLAESSFLEDIKSTFQEMRIS